MDPHLHALALGALVGLLREQRGLQQGELAAQLALTTSKMSRLEKGQAQTDAWLLQRLGGFFEMDAGRLLALVDQGIERSEAIARQQLPIRGSSWWPAAQRRLGSGGADALVKLAVAVVLSKT